MMICQNQTWRLNERHYGGLTGLNKAETAEKHGEAQVSTRLCQSPTSFILSIRPKKKAKVKKIFRSKFGGDLLMSPLRT